MRFTPSQSGVADLLPGIVFSELSEEYQRAEAQPLASLPREIRSQDARFQYQAHYRLLGDSASAFVGDQVAGLNQGPPYEGWARLLPRVESLLGVLRRSGLVSRVERYSIKFTNVLEASGGDRLAMLRFKVSLADFHLGEAGMTFRTELNDERLGRIIQIIPQATVSNPRSAPAEGLLVALDCIRNKPESDFLESPRRGLEEVHTELKRLFFGMLTPDTLASLGPSYDS